MYVSDFTLAHSWRLVVNRLHRYVASQLWSLRLPQSVWSSLQSHMKSFLANLTSRYVLYFYDHESCSSFKCVCSVACITMTRMMLHLRDRGDVSEDGSNRSRRTVLSVHNSADYPWSLIFGCMCHTKFTTFNDFPNLLYRRCDVERHRDWTSSEQDGVLCSFLLFDALI